MVKELYTWMEKQVVTEATFTECNISLIQQRTFLVQLTLLGEVVAIIKTILMEKKYHETEDQKCDQVWADRTK